MPSRCRRDLGTPRFTSQASALSRFFRASFHGPGRRLGVVGRWYEPRSVLICSYVPSDSPPAASRRVSRTMLTGPMRSPGVPALGCRWSRRTRTVHESVLQPSKCPAGLPLASNWHFNLVSVCFCFTTARDLDASSEILYVCAP